MTFPRGMNAELVKDRYDAPANRARSGSCITLDELRLVLEQLDATATVLGCRVAEPKGMFRVCLSCDAVLATDGSGQHTSDCRYIDASRTIKAAITHGEEVQKRHADGLLVWRAEHDPPVESAHAAGSRQERERIVRLLKSDRIDDFFDDCEPTPTNIASALENGTL